MAHSTLPRGRAGLLVVLLCSLTSGLAWAQIQKEAKTSLDVKQFYKPELHITTSHVPLEEVMGELANRSAWEAFAQRRPEGLKAFVDPRSGIPTNVIVSWPLIPGKGVGNHLAMSDLARSLGRPVQKVDGDVVAAAVLGFVRSQRAVFGIDMTQLGAARATQVNENLWQVSIPQVVGGVPVRDGRFVATISHGNLVVAGAETWGNARVATTPKVTADQALDAGFGYANGRGAEDVIVRAPRLEIVPFAPPQHQAGEAFAGRVGQGYGHLLVWTFVFQRPPQGAHWEVMVDAQTGEIVAFQDINQYADGQFTGGVYPLTDTGQCPDAQRCGTMQSNYPMPYANTGFASPNNFTNSAGLYTYTSGTATTTLSGKYINISDNCGSISESSGTGSINLGGTNGQHDCTSSGASAGDTPASRSGFYELNKLAEQARGWLPSNTWLQSQLTANMNINLTCNAFWNGSTVNFYRSGGGCRNTGEIAAVFDHEWGHGLDDNDAAGVLSNSSEAYADIAAIYRLQASCVGYGFFETVDKGCGQTSDGTGFNTNEALQGAAYCATNCSGVRDTDYAKHSPATPATPLGFVCGQCTSGTGPCGKQVHCSAAPVRQAAWDLVARDLPAAGFDSQTSFLIGNRLFYQGSGNIGAWHSCTCGSSASGCGASNGYMQWLTADDDNGNLNDGTPHMTAIFNAYNRHGIACSTPTVQTSGCSAGPSGTTTLSVTPGNLQNALSWTTVTGATRYWVFRTEGQAGCNFGKTKIAEVTGTTYTDTQVANGRTYYYNVVPAGASSACHGGAGSCVSGTPAPPTNPDFGVAASPSSVSVQQGASANTTITVTSTNSFNSAVSLSASGLPSGVTASFSPSSVTPPANGSATSTLTFTASATASTGTFSVTVTGTSGSTSHSATVSLTVTSTGGPVTVFYDGAESASTTLTFSSTTSTTVWTRNSTSPFAGSWRWRAGSATPDTSNYGNNGDARATTPVLDLSGASTVTLTYAYKYHTEATFDFFQVRISTDGGTNWTNLVNVSGASPNWNGWSTNSINLNAYAGQTNVKIQFRLTTDPSVTDFGAAVDEIKVVKQ